MDNKNNKVTINIDNKAVSTGKGETILQVAEQNDIFIPSLCAHPELDLYGGCRICIVEVDKMRGYPTACTTRVEEGMVIRTNTNALQEMRKEVLQLILSEHPSGCLVCKEDCTEFTGTMRKVGITTGCRWCPQDRDCDLQKVVDYLAIEEVEFPVSYREFPVETYDPFFDRDYNLCIYCGRCVRICGEHRKSSVISLKQRGRFSTIGPSFDKTHIESDCEFCGACVSVCPTGTMSEKNRKWTGVPDSCHKSFCPLCSINCEIQVSTKKDRIVGTLPPGDPPKTGGELCVKGRFCLAELVNHPDRVTEPRYRFPQGEGIVSWDEAISKAHEQLKSVEGDRTAVYLSPGLTLEEMAAARQFAEKVIGTPHITSSALTGNMISFLSLAEKSVPLQEVEKAGAIVSFLLDGNYNYAPVTLAVKRAADKGIPYYQVGWKRDTTSRFAAGRIIPSPGKEASFFKEIVQTLQNQEGGSTPGVKELSEAIKNSSSPLFIVGPGMLDLTAGDDILQSIKTMIDVTGANVLATNPYGNLIGLLSLVNAQSHETVCGLIEEGKIDLLYLVGDMPFRERPPVKFILHQAAFLPPEEISADLVLPAAVWGEVSGTYVDMNNTRKKINAVTEPSGKVFRHPEIFEKIVNAGKKKSDVSFAQQDLSKLIPDRLALSTNPLTGKDTSSKTKAAKVTAPDSTFPYLLIQEKNPHTFQGVSLSKMSGGMKAIVPGDTIIINPRDASGMELSDVDAVIVKSKANGSGSEKTFPIRCRRTVSPGYLYLITSSDTFPFKANPIPVQVRKVAKEV